MRNTILNSIWQILTVTLVSLTVTSCGDAEPSKNKLAEAKKTSNKLKMFERLASSETGVKFANTLSPEQELVFYDFQYQFNGGGVGVADFDNDGLQDIFFTGNEVSNKLYKNLGNLKFEDVTEKAGVGQEGFWCNGITIIDINNDGLQDIYISRGGFMPREKRKNSLLINKGNFQFEEKADEFGIADTGYTTQSAFLDFDQDGDLDLYVLNHDNNWQGGMQINKEDYKRHLVTEDRFYINNGGQFVEDSRRIGLVQEIAGGYGLGVSVCDVNNDEYPDLYISNDYDSPDRLYVNQQNGTFKEEIKERMTHVALYSMGNDYADLNNDGFGEIVALDMSAEDHVRIKTQMGAMAPEKFYELVKFGFPHQYMYNSLQYNNGNGTFSDIAQLAGISSTDWSWAPLIADFDNDGFKDIFISNGYRLDDRDNDFNKRALREFGDRAKVKKENRRKVFDLTPSTPISNYMYQNDGDLTFSKKTYEWNLGEKGFSMGSAFCDLDKDGDLDLIVNNLEKESFIYKNNSSEKNNNNYLRVKLNFDGKSVVGTKVELKTTTFSQTQFINPTRGYVSSVEKIAHFGIPNGETIKQIIVTWPDRTVKVYTDLKLNQEVEIFYSDGKAKGPKETQVKKIFEHIEIEGLTYTHQENSYDDFEKEILLPHRNSQHGPEIVSSDVNGDNLDDVFICGAHNQPGTLFIQNLNGSFSKNTSKGIIQDRAYEDVGAHFFDANGDGAIDLYVASGGNEFPKNNNMYLHRLYLNDGKGNFAKSKNILPNIVTSGKEVTSADIDKDGDLDLFVGGRIVPGEYPFAPRSYILINENGKFIDRTETLAPDLMYPGLVTDAQWVDINSDGNMDIVVVGEWMPILALINKNGKFEKDEKYENLYKTTGWWFSINVGDFNKDGQPDFLAGNLGKNYKYKASHDEPFQVWCHDFDNSGSLDIVLGYFDHGVCFPVRGRSCSSQQMPFIKSKYPTFESFANATISDIYGKSLNEALNLKASTFSNSVILSTTERNYKVTPLSNQFQFSCIQDAIIEDFDGDGALDVVGGGNLYTAEVETPRNDASIGFFAKGDNSGNFTFIPYSKSGISMSGDVKDLERINGNDDKKIILVGSNDFKLDIIVK